MSQEIYHKIHNALSKAIEERHSNADLDDIAFYPDAEDDGSYAWRYDVGIEQYWATYEKRTGKVIITKVGDDK